MTTAAESRQIVGPVALLATPILGTSGVKGARSCQISPISANGSSATRSELALLDI